jgi:hypothetical protein
MLFKVMMLMHGTCEMQLAAAFIRHKNRVQIICAALETQHTCLQRCLLCYLLLHCCLQGWLLDVLNGNQPGRRLVQVLKRCLRAEPEERFAPGRVLGDVLLWPQHMKPLMINMYYQVRCSRGLHHAAGA